MPSKKVRMNEGATQASARRTTTAAAASAHATVISPRPSLDTPDSVTTVGPL